MRYLFLIVIVALALPLRAKSEGFRGSIDFTPGEKAAHERHIGTITRVARRYLEDVWKEHLDFYRRHHVSKFYGDRSLALNTREKRIEALRQAGAPTSLVDELRPTSCVGLSLEGLAAGVRAARDPVLEGAWRKIQAYTRANDQDGSALINALQKLGWRVCFWNPAPKDNARWDAEEQNWRSKGWHAYRYSTVMNRGNYYYNRVDDKSLLVGFDTRVPAEFRNAPFFVAVAHTGYHVFLGFDGEVIEGHSTRPLNSIDNLQRSPFNPLATGGAPRWTATEKYRSGLIALPPQ